MSTATIELYNALIEAGVDKDKAEAAAKAVISRTEAEHFATKADLQGMENRLIMWMIGLLVALGAFLFATLS